MIFSIMRIPVSTLSLLMNTAPFWAAVLAYIIFGEMILKFELICMLGCFFGVIILTNGQEKD